MKKPLKQALFASLILLLLAAAGILAVRRQGNFHPVLAGEVYRSAQLNPEQLSEYIGKYGFRSILNLRGRNEDSKWWVDEVNLAGRLGINHYDVALSSKKSPTPEQIREIEQILQTAPKPLLIHCEAGADRSGLVSAIYLVDVAGYPYRKARRQLSFIYGHVPLLRPKTRAMDQSLLEFCSRKNPLQETTLADSSLPAYR